MDEYLSTRKAADFLGIHEQTLLNWAAAGRVAYSKLPSGRYRFAKTDLEAILKPPDDAGGQR